MHIKRLKDDEYEIQHYGECSSSFMEDFKECAMAAINGTIDNLEDLVFRDFKGDKTLYQHGILALRQEYKKITDETVEKHRDSIRAYFAIPEHVVLPKDAHRNEYTPEDVATSEKEITELEHEYLKQKAILTLCRKEMEIVESLRPVREKVDKMTAKVKEVNEANVERERRLEAHRKSMDEFEKAFDIKPIDYIRLGYVKK